MGKRKRKKTPEERAAELKHSKDLDRRLIAKIEEYRARSGDKRPIGADLDRRLRAMIERYRKLSTKRRPAGGSA